PAMRASVHERRRATGRAERRGGARSPRPSLSPPGAGGGGRLPPPGGPPGPGKWASANPNPPRPGGPAACHPSARPPPELWGLRRNLSDLALKRCQLFLIQLHPSKRQPTIFDRHRLDHLADLPEEQVDGRRVGQRQLHVYVRPEDKSKWIDGQGVDPRNPQTDWLGSRWPNGGWDPGEALAVDHEPGSRGVGRVQHRAVDDVDISKRDGARWSLPRLRPPDRVEMQMRAA